MNSLIPIQYYTPIFFHIILIVVLIVVAQSQSFSLSASNNLSGKKLLGLFLLLFTTLYMGLRPLSYRFGDMINYSIELNQYVFGAQFDYKKERLFELMKYFFAKNLNADIFFFTCAVLYVFPLYYATKRMFDQYWFYAFIMLLSSFSFWGYGVNGVRNGIATSLFLLAITRKGVFKIILLVVIVFIHKSLAIVVLAYFAINFYKKTRSYMAFWFLAIPLALVFGGFFESFFLGLGMGEEKLEGYLGEFDQIKEGVALKVGFRWDFLIYSATGVFAAWYYIFKMKYEDLFYNNIVNLYLLVNAFWILIIKANYSNRFAYLSWFMLGIVIIYPLLKSEIVNRQHLVIGRILLIYFSFTYLMNVILAN